jgi:crotonobetainyl-CoA:carnitine CoA-transferase CaiB-like acyl-CoA transferase
MGWAARAPRSKPTQEDEHLGRTNLIQQAPAATMLAGVRVIELADEQAEYAGLLLAGLGAEVIKVEPPGGSATRRIGPFLADQPDPETSLFFWHFDRAKKSIVLDLETEGDGEALRDLVARADVVLDSTPRDYLGANNLGLDALRRSNPTLITARMSPFGDTGPWSNWKASDLVHLALGGVMMNCGYDPQPDGTYDVPPIAPQMWHAYHIAGEQMAMMIVGALVQRQATGRGQHLSEAIHEAVSKCTEMDLTSWTMRAIPFYRQTCRHAAQAVSTVPTIAYTKDGRWILIQPIVKEKVPELLDFLAAYGMDEPLRSDFARLVPAGTSLAPVVKGRYIPGSSAQTDLSMRCQEALQRLFAKFTFADAPWREAQEAGVLVAPLRRPEENVSDEHWRARRTFAEIHHPEMGRPLSYVTSKWVSDETSWAVGRRAPRLDADRVEILAVSPSAATKRLLDPDPATEAQRPFPLAGVRVFDFSWFLATAGGTRFLAAMGADVIKVEWRANPDSRLATTAMAPRGGRAARDRATGPLEAVSAEEVGDDYQNMGGQFHIKNPGKRGISLNVRDPRGLEIAKRLIAKSDIVAEGFSPGVLEKWGLGYDVLRSIRPDIIYAKQSGMGAVGTYGRLRTVGPVAAAFAGNSEQSGLPEPALPAGWGYSYLDWMGAYSFALAMVSALHYRNVTGRGQWIDASQCEAGLFVAGTAYLDHSANGRSTHRIGNRSPYKPAAPHGAYRCAGADSWLAISAFDEDWSAFCRAVEHEEWLRDSRFATLADRLAHQDELDLLVSEWTCRRDAFEAMRRLQEAGVAAGVCQTAADRVDRDPQLRHLQWMTELVGTKIGTWPVPEVPVRMSGARITVAGPTNRGAPNYGEDNASVYGELLGLSAAEIARLAADDVI